MSRYSDATMPAIQRAGCAMIFFGAESGSDWVLDEMQKGITTEQTLTMARRTREFGIIPSFHLCLGIPMTRSAIPVTPSVHSQAKKINPDAEIIVQHYTPTPQPGKMYGESTAKSISRQSRRVGHEAWMDFTLRIDTSAPWLRKKTRKRIDNFERLWPRAGRRCRIFARPDGAASC